MLCGAVLMAGGCEDPVKPTPTPTPVDPVDPTPPDNPDKTPYFKASIQDLYAFNCGNNGVDIPYETNISGWTAVSDQSWCSVSINESDIVVILDEYVPRLENGAYLYTVPRTCSVTVTAGTTFSKTFQVLQESKAIIVPPDTPVLLSAAGGTAKVSIRTNCYDWRITCDASWLTCTKLDGQTLSVTSTARSADEKEPRKTTVTITSSLDDWVYANITVSDADASLGGEDYNYGDHTDWD